MSTEKTHQEVAEIIQRYAKNYGGHDSRIVFTNGCFDILHPGHLDVIKKCRELAGPRGTVVVGVNSDESVRRLKGPNRPIINGDARCEVVASVEGVDFAVMFDEDTPRELLESLRPAIIVKGGDYQAKDVVGADLAIVIIVPTRPGFSTSDILSRLSE